MKHTHIPIHVRRLLPLVVLVNALSVAMPVWAQAGVAVDTLEIQLWPEYDQPAMLVILTGTLKPSVALPAQVTVRIPAAAEKPHAVAVRDQAGQLSDTPYTISAEGDWLLVTLPAESPIFRVEYYDRALSINAEQRTFEFSWKADFSITSASVRVQMPVNATGFSSAPELTPIGPGDFGLDYFQGALGSVASGQGVTLNLTYNKPDTTLSADVLGQPEPLTPAMPEPAQPALLQPWLVAGGVLGVLLIAAGGAYVYWTRSRATDRKIRTRRSRPRPSAARAESEPAPAGAGYCTQCGQPRLPGDRFCRSCGAALD